MLNFLLPLNRLSIYFASFTLYIFNFLIQLDKIYSKLSSFNLEPTILLSEFTLRSGFEVEKLELLPGFEIFLPEMEVYL